MPVRGLSERTRVPRLGKIRLGDKSGTNGAPKAQPYFVIPDELKAEYGDKPSALKIVFLSDDEEQIASQWYRAYNATHGRICIGDGSKADALLDADVLKADGGDVSAPMNVNLWAHGATRGRTKTENVVRREIECLGAGIDGAPPCPLYAQKDCGIKMFMQYAVIGAPGVGVYQTDTGSAINIQRVNGLIRMVKNMLGGRIAGIPLVLKRVQAEVAPPPDMRKKTIWTIDLEVDPAMNAGRMLAAAAREPIYALMPSPDESEALEGIDYENFIEGEVIKHGEEQEVIAGESGDAVPTEAAKGPTPPASPPEDGPVTALMAQAQEWGLSWDSVIATSQQEFANREPKDLNTNERNKLLTIMRSAAVDAMQTALPGT